MVMECSWLSGQDAHERLQVAEWLTASLYQCSREVSDMSWLHNLYIVQALKKKALSHLYCCLQEKGAHKQWYRAWKKRGKKALPNVEDRTLTVRPPRSKDRLFSTLIVYIAPTWHHWSRLPHTCINKQKMRTQTWRLFIVFSFSTIFPCLLVNRSFISGVGAPLH